MKDTNKISIAHRGASGYLPEHTLEAKALAYMMGVDYLEQDLAMTKDDKLIVIHDLFLDRNTNVSEVFPNRHRENGRYYAIDFTLDEIKSLNFTEGFSIKNGEKIQDYPNRFPMNKSTFKIHTYEEEIEFIQGLNKTTGKNVGIYTETKGPWFHKQNGKDISKATLKVMKEYGYDNLDSKVYFQTFDYPDLKYVVSTLFKEFNMNIKTILLYAYNEWLETYEYVNNNWTPFDFEKISTIEGMKEVSNYATGLGPAYSMLVDTQENSKEYKISDFVKKAHSLNLVVHPYTARKDALPAYANNFNDLLNIILVEAGADGLFSDFPDLLVNFMKNIK